MRDKDRDGLGDGHTEMERQRGGGTGSTRQDRVLRDTREHTRLGGRTPGSIRELPPVYMRYGRRYRNARGGSDRS